MTLMTESLTFAAVLLLGSPLLAVALRAGIARDIRRAERHRRTAALRRLAGSLQEVSFGFRVLGERVVETNAGMLRLIDRLRLDHVTAVDRTIASSATIGRVTEIRDLPDGGIEVVAEIDDV